MAPAQYWTSDAVLNIWHYLGQRPLHRDRDRERPGRAGRRRENRSSFEVVVSNVAPDLTLLATPPVEQNLPYTLTLGGVYDRATTPVTHTASLGDIGAPCR